MVKTIDIFSLQLQNTWLLPISRRKRSASDIQKLYFSLFFFGCSRDRKLLTIARAEFMRKEKGLCKLFP